MSLRKTAMSTKATYEYPEFFSFPPFFTIQPVLETREKQLALWREMIVQYHSFHRIPILIVHDCPLWSNPTIERSLSPSDIQIIMEDFCKSGHGEWQDPDKTRCRILWRKPEEIASDLYDWATTHGMVGSVCTLYELHSGEDVGGMSFQGLDEELLRRALEILQSQGKCTIFQGETSSEDGIKFF